LAQCDFTFLGDIMLRSFGCIVILCMATLPRLAQAREVRLACHDETYVCYTDDSDITKCRWQAGDDYEVRVEMVRDNRYPNASSPQSVWAGQYSERVLDALASLNITLIESPNGAVGYSNVLRLTMGSITSETTGVTYLRNALRVKDEGTGFSCTITGA
jgi:hypothetical protein